jgi:hypothetical protein
MHGLCLRERRSPTDPARVFFNVHGTLKTGSVPVPGWPPAAPPAPRLPLAAPPTRPTPPPRATTKRAVPGVSPKKRQKSQ